MSHYLFEKMSYQTFPAKIFITSIDYSSMHWHYDGEFILVLKGTLEIKLEKTEWLFNAGELVFINPKLVHGMKRTNQDNICLIIQLNERFFQESKHGIQQYAFFLNSQQRGLEPKIDIKIYRKILAEIGLISLDKAASDYRLKSKIYELLAELFENAEHEIRQFANGQETGDSEQLLRIIAYVEKNYRHSDIAQAIQNDFGINEKKLYRFLKKTTGQSFRELVQRYRLDQAKYMLSFTDKTILYIIDECGFGSENTFYRLFKMDVGVTPFVFRQQSVHQMATEKVNGYLDFDQSEAVTRLKKIVQETK